MTTTPFTLGVCDYPEQVPRAQWEGHAAQQKALGLSWVRIGEFAWSQLEPTAGNFNWDWLDQAIEVYQQAGLKVVLCTPTAAPPLWLVQAHPEILPWDQHGKVRQAGSRRHCDLASRVYLDHAVRITRAVAARYGQHEAVIGWQLDNELGCHDTTRSHGPASQQGFRAWLQGKYPDLQDLNASWGTVFWGQEVSDWAQILPPNLTVAGPNPAHVLDFYRFCSDQVEHFVAAQVKVLRELSPGRFITHNFMGFFADFDHHAVAKHLDLVSWDMYPTGMLEVQAPWESQEIRQRYARVGHPDLIAFNHDLYRGMKGRGFWVMEQQCGQTNWAHRNALPADGAVQLWTAQAWAHGADAVACFRWRAATMGQEALHSGLLRHDGTPDRGFGEWKRLNHSAFQTGPVRTHVALLHDHESQWMFDLHPHHQELGYWRQMMLYYSTLRSLGMDVDVVHPDQDLSGYFLVVAPALMVVTPERAARLEQLSQRTVLVFGPRAGTWTGTGRIPESGPPGPLAGLMGGTLKNFDALPDGTTETAGQYQISHWAESYQVQDAQSLHVYDSGPLVGECAVMLRGKVLTIGANSQGLIYDLLRAAINEAGLSPLDVPEGIRISRRAGNMLVQNFNPHGVDFMGNRMSAISFDLLEGQG